MQKIVEINHAQEKLAKCRDDIQNADWWKEKQSQVNGATTVDEVWPFLKKTMK
jgi:hypothetical protein